MGDRERPRGSLEMGSGALNVGLRLDLGLGESTWSRIRWSHQACAELLFKSLQISKCIIYTPHLYFRLPYTVYDSNYFVLSILFHSV